MVTNRYTTHVHLHANLCYDTKVYYYKHNIKVVAQQILHDYRNFPERKNSGTFINFLTRFPGYPGKVVTLFLSFFLIWVAHAPFTCQRWGLPDLMVCVVCSCLPCRAIVGGIGSGETVCHDIYPARPITTVSLTANTYCMMDGHSSCAPRTMSPRVQFSGACEQNHWWPASHTAYSRRPSVISGSSSD